MKLAYIHSYSSVPMRLRCYGKVSFGCGRDIFAVHYSQFLEGYREGGIANNENNKRSFNKKINKMTEVEKVIKQGQKDAAEKLRLFSVSGSLRPVLLLASYCGNDNPNCTDTKPCDECLKMCNIAFVEDKDIDINKVVCGFDFVEDYC